MVRRYEGGFEKNLELKVPIVAAQRLAPIAQRMSPRLILQKASSSILRLAFAITDYEVRHSAIQLVGAGRLPARFTEAFVQK